MKPVHRNLRGTCTQHTFARNIPWHRYPALENETSFDGCTKQYKQLKYKAIYNRLHIYPARQTRPNGPALAPARSMPKIT